MLNRQTLIVTGMTCDGCVASVTRVLSRVPGVNDVDVNRVLGRAVVGGDASMDALANAVRKAGFTRPAWQR